MKLKHLLFFLFLMWFGAFVNAQSTAPYNHLLITEFRGGSVWLGYVEITNKGTETINLSEFEMGQRSEKEILWEPSDPRRQFGRLPNQTLAPGESWVISQVMDFGPYMWTIDPLHYLERYVHPEMATLSDVVLHRDELGVPGLDSVSPNWMFLGSLNHGRDCIFLRHHFINPETNQADSMFIDQVNGIFSGADQRMKGGANDVAGVAEASKTHLLVRRNYVTTGITEFSSHEANNQAAAMQFSNNRGLGLDDSEWMPIPFPQGLIRAPFWTVGNSVNAVIDANTLKPKVGTDITVDLDGGIITVPWGIRNDDSIMYKFERKPGLAWRYDYSVQSGDSAYISIRTGDKLTIYACGDKLTVKEFNLVVKDPILSENRVIPKNTYNYTDRKYPSTTTPFHGMRVSEGANTMDTISRLPYATRVDSLFKYLEKPPQAKWEIVFKSGVEKPDLQTGDILRVTGKGLGEDKVKDYYIKLAEYIPSPNAYLGSITWPDMPESFKGAIAAYYGWEGDTIPGFSPTVFNYVVTVPFEYQGIPQIVFTKQDLNSKVVVDRAKNIGGTVADRTVTFTVTAEDGDNTNVYHVRFDAEKDPDNVQPWIGEPFISRWIYKETWTNGWIQICNPGTEPLDLSNYLIASGLGEPIDVFNTATSPTHWGWTTAYRRYVPGKKWQGEADWIIGPGILVDDYATYAIVQPGDVFVITHYLKKPASYPKGVTDTPFRDDIDIDFNNNPWGRTVDSNNNLVNIKLNETFCMWKILNDSVKNGWKPATDINDFELIDVLGSGGLMETMSFGGVPVTATQSIERKPSIYKGNPVVMGSNGTNEETNEWLPITNSPYWIALGFPEWGDSWWRLPTGIGSHTMDEITFYKSTVSSTVYKVSPGFGQTETIKGVKAGETVEGLYANLIKADELQTLKVMSAGTEVPLAGAVSNGDILVVLSADSTNTTKYILDVGKGLSSDALLTSSRYTVAASGPTGVIGGFDFGTTLKTVLFNINVPAGATLTVIDGQSAYVPLKMLNYDTAYVSVTVNDNIYFSVVAEDGVTEIVYQLNPSSKINDAFVTSYVYSVNQREAFIQFIPYGTTASILKLNVTPAPGATVQVVDKMNFVRENGNIYKDDKLVVTAKDGITTKTYFFSMLSSDVTDYLAYVVSNVYTVDQLQLTIGGATSLTTLGDFKANLTPAFGATMTVLDKDGNEKSILANLSTGDKLRVTAADSSTIATYNINVDVTGINTIVETIKMYPNPTTGRVIIQGLSNGNRVRVFNSSGVTLRDVTVDNSTEYVSLAAQPAGLYVFVISSGEKLINIQKIIKK